MILSFHRSQAIPVRIQKPDTLRAFVFEVQVGFKKNAAPQVDPSSGMLVNLVNVDAMLAALARRWSTISWATLQELVLASQQLLATQAQAEGVVLTELCLQEKRGFRIVWKNNQWCMGGEVFKELNGRLFKISWEEPFVEERLETQECLVHSAAELFSEDVFQKNPPLQSLEVEDLVHFEKWSLRRNP